MLHSSHGLPRNTLEGVLKKERSIILQVQKVTKLLKSGIESDFIETTRL